MAISKVLEKNRLIVSVTNEETGKHKQLSFSRIDPKANDEALHSAGDAIGNLQKYPVAGIELTVTAALRSDG